MLLTFPASKLAHRLTHLLTQDLAVVQRLRQMPGSRRPQRSAPPTRLSQLPTGPTDGAAHRHRRRSFDAFALTFVGVHRLDRQLHKVHLDRRLHRAWSAVIMRIAAAYCRTATANAAPVAALPVSDLVTFVIDDRLSRTARPHFRSCRRDSHTSNSTRGRVGWRSRAAPRLCQHQS